MLNLRKLLGNTSYISFAVQIERVCLLDAFTGLYHKQEILYIMLTTTQHLPRENPPTRGHEMNYVFFWRNWTQTARDIRDFQEDLTLTTHGAPLLKGQMV